MSPVSAALIKDLRERTGLGMMDCKKALEETGGDIELAIENLRKSSALKAAKKSSRVAAEGVVRAASKGELHVLLEVNSETDFVARDENFLNFVAKTAEQALKTPDLDALNGTMEEVRSELVQKVGENIQIRRLETLKGAHVYSYVHTNQRVGALVSLEKADPELGADLAMQIVAMNPEYLSPEEVPASRLEKEKEIFLAQNADSGKNPEVLEKMVQGRLNKFKSEVSLLGQAFVKDNKLTISAHCQKKGNQPLGFVKLLVGEGIEKEEVDFAKEVMAQVAKH